MKKLICIGTVYSDRQVNGELESKVAKDVDQSWLKSNTLLLCLDAVVLAHTDWTEV